MISTKFITARRLAWLFSEASQSETNDSGSAAGHCDGYNMGERGDATPPKVNQAYGSRP